ncbi:uncharacterized protein ColSpa_03543 [Colletotrichum spaethianum]|uniref:Uncharacterized protein n=1 Tax=Colletotrichum spaethianum TaxID=700344 RepID=A0AA37LFS2_9PEZI|nr:uncharacterized protein ColSpa_03543 [Colletotrichum spaethianum]GKT43362.1 hypothetical protein ColSpa_03543 [Colletotrichum spaethianum]
MLFTNVASTAVAACALLVPSVLVEVKLQWHPTGDCSTNGGPQGTYGPGTCISLRSTSKTVKILSHKGFCNLVTYTANGCWTSSGRNSAKVEC